MPIHPEIAKAVTIIEQRIESLKRIRESLVSEFGVDGTSVAPPVKPPQTEIPTQALLAGMKQTSKNRIAQHLAIHQPASRRDIARATGIPDGTVSYALNDKNRFVRTEHGWMLAVQEASA